MNRLPKFIYTWWIAVILLWPSAIFSQDATPLPADSTCVQQDISDVIRHALNKPPKVKSAQEGSLILLPIVGSNPSTGFMVGIGGQYAFRMPESTRYSLISGSVQYTTKNQFIFMLKNTVFSKSDKIFYSGDWRYLIFSQSTYGLGTNSPEGGILDYQYSLAGLETSSDSLAQPMEFNFIRLHQSMAFRVNPDMYLGFGYFYDAYTKIKDTKLNLNPGEELITSHYAYNTYYRFDTEHYFNSAISAMFVIDKRDNMINAFKGYYLSVGWRGAFVAVGNRNNTNMFNVEWRSFHPVSKTNPRHLVAFWLLGDFTQDGDLPYMILPATAYDQRGRSARGYTQGRFRGPQMVYGEAEYRFPISRCSGVLGGVVFANATTATNQILDLKLFGSVKPGYGVGLRIMADKSSRTNLSIDFGFGDKSVGFYLAASETF
jgi:hypothetical protein